MAGLASAALTGFRGDPTRPAAPAQPGAPVPKMTQEKDSKPAFLAVAFRHEPLRWVLKIGEIELEPPMRSILAGATDQVRLRQYQSGKRKDVVVIREREARHCLACSPQKSLRLISSAPGSPGALRSMLTKPGRGTNFMAGLRCTGWG